MDIIEEFMEGLDLDLDTKDVIVTGSIANYNWSKFSDIDLHILLDFAEINEDKEMVKKFFDAVRSNWNKLHNITVKGHEVEIYVQDEKEPHISTGVYSLSGDRWLVKPKKVRPAIDRHTALKKMRHLSREIEKLSLIHDRQDYDKSFALAERLKEKIKKMRQSGLESTGIYSPENLAFKMLRRSGDIEQLFAVFTDAYDKLHSVEQ
jgi:predicted nucleotidyltransferase